MSQEINPIKPGSFLGVPELRLLQTETEEQKPVFVGGVIYNQGQNALVFGEQNHQLLVSPLDPEQNTDFVAALKDTSRILTLNTFTEVAVRQVGINGITVKKNQSVYQHDPLSIEFSVLNPETSEKEKVSVGEQDLLDIFSGEKGGIAVFSGKGFPEETGLLFERQSGDQKQAIILFMHPQEEGVEDYNSVVGLGEFIRQVSDALLENTNLPIQQQALAIIEAKEKAGKLDFSNAVRKEIFHMQVIAYAQKAARGDKNAAKKLKELTPKVKRWQRKRNIEKYEQTVAETIDTIIIDFSRPIQSERIVENKPQDKYQIQTSKAAEIRQAFEDTSLPEGISSILNNIDQWTVNAKTQAEIDDLNHLITEIFAELSRPTYRFRGKDVNRTRIRLTLQDAVRNRAESLQENNQEAATSDGTIAMQSIENEPIEATHDGTHDQAS